MFAWLLAVAVVAQSDPAPAAPLSSLIGEGDYPPAAVRQGAAGRVGFRLTVDATGKVDGCTVVAPSPSKDLDEATCAVMLARARFAPAVDATGRHVRGMYTGAVRWGIETEHDVIPWAPLVASVRVAIDANGGLAPCAGASAMPGGLSCDAFDDPAAIARMLGRPLRDLAWIDLVVRIEPQGASSPAVVTAPGDIRLTVARSLLTVAPSGAITACNRIVAARVNGKAADLCDGIGGDPLFAATGDKGAPRSTMLTVDMVGHPR